MTLHRHDFLLVVILAAAAATPAFGQAAAPTVALAKGENAASIADFSGIWAHPSFPGFEPVASGPTSVTNRVRRPQVTDADGRILPAGNSVLVSNPAQLVGDYTNQILKPHAAE